MGAVAQNSGLMGNNSSLPISEEDSIVNYSSYYYGATPGLKLESSSEDLFI